MKKLTLEDTKKLDESYKEMDFAICKLPRILIESNTDELAKAKFQLNNLRFDRELENTLKLKDKMIGTYFYFKCDGKSGQKIEYYKKDDSTLRIILYEGLKNNKGEWRYVASMVGESRK